MPRLFPPVFGPYAHVYLDEQSNCQQHSLLCYIGQCQNAPVMCYLAVFPGHKSVMALTLHVEAKAVHCRGELQTGPLCDALEPCIELHALPQLILDPFLSAHTTSLDSAHHDAVSDQSTLPRRTMLS